MNDSQNTTVFVIIYYLGATCFDSYESSSGSLIPIQYYLIHKALWDPIALTIGGVTVV